MTQVLSTKEITTRVADQFIVNGKWDEDGERYRGNLTNGRIANVYAADRDGMVHVMLLVPGGGDFTIGFKLFREDATEERIARFVDYMVKTQKKNVERYVPYNPNN